MQIREDFVGVGDKSALLAFSNAEFQEQARTALAALGFKVHTAIDHEQFILKFGQLEYQLVVVEELYHAVLPEENQTLQWLQHLPMNLRRHATVILVGSNFQTLNSMQAFQHSVHAVINYTDFPMFGQLAQKVMNENDVFLRPLREIAQRVAQGK